MTDNPGKRVVPRSPALAFLRRTLAACLLLAASGGLVIADDAPKTPQLSSRAPALPDKFRGETVTVPGENLPREGVKIWLRTGREKPVDKGFPLDATVAPDGRSVSFTLPRYPSFDAGRYLVFVDLGATELAVPGDLRVLAD